MPPCLIRSSCALPSLCRPLASLPRDKHTRARTHAHTHTHIRSRPAPTGRSVTGHGSRGQSVTWASSRSGPQGRASLSCLSPSPSLPPSLHVTHVYVTDCPRAVTHVTDCRTRRSRSRALSLCLHLPFLSFLSFLYLSLSLPLTHTHTHTRTRTHTAVLLHAIHAPR